MKELDKNELKKVDGGWTRLLLTFGAALVAEVVYDGFQQCMNDFAEGYESVRN